MSAGKNENKKPYFMDVNGQRNTKPLIDISSLTGIQLCIRYSHPKIKS